jgi:hypothetical protein
VGTSGKDSESYWRKEVRMFQVLNFPFSHFDEDGKSHYTIREYFRNDSQEVAEKFCRELAERKADKYFVVKECRQIYLSDFSEKSFLNP